MSALLLVAFSLLFTLFPFLGNQGNSQDLSYGPISSATQNWKQKIKSYSINQIEMSKNMT
jgi:hypothetical protein